MSKPAPPSSHARTRRDMLFQNNLSRKPMPVAEDQGVQSRYSMHVILHLIRLLPVLDSRSISPTGHVSSRQPNPTKSLVSSSKNDQHVFCTRDGVCVTSPCASVNPLGFSHAYHSCSFLDGHHETDGICTDGLSILGSLTSATYHASSTVCLRNLGGFGSRSTGMIRTGKHWRSVNCTSTSLQPASPSSRPVNSRPASSISMHTRMRAVRTPEAVRLHASSLLVQIDAGLLPLVKGLERVACTSDHDTCIRPYDRLHATTLFSSLVYLFLFTSCRDFH
jgi:hypothetical protein